MSDLASPRIRTLAAPTHAPRPLPRGFGLLLGAMASLGLWAGLAAAVIRFWL